MEDWSRLEDALELEDEARWALYTYRSKERAGTIAERNLTEGWHTAYANVQEIALGLGEPDEAVSSVLRRYHAQRMAKAKIRIKKKLK